ncbi:MAG TPA: DUF6781 family protein [Rhizobacter sp.]|nr:DUF6781 family protein [Rhizobacter sp.]
MKKFGIDQDALVEMFSSATSKQGEALRTAVRTATLKALEGREMTLANIREVLDTVTKAASTGALGNKVAGADVEGLLGKAVAGMDSALLQAVEAQRVAIERFVEQGVSVQQTQLKSALDNLEKMEDMIFTTVSKAAEGVGQPLQGPWDKVLGGLKVGGTDSGAKAVATAEEMLAAARNATREGRALGASAAEELMKSYAALVSGVLIGMSEGLRQESPRGEAPAAKPARKR